MNLDPVGSVSVFIHSVFIQNVTVGRHKFIDDYITVS